MGKRWKQLPILTPIFGARFALPTKGEGKMYAFASLLIVHINCRRICYSREICHLNYISIFSWLFHCCCCFFTLFPSSLALSSVHALLSTSAHTLMWNYYARKKNVTGNCDWWIKKIKRIEKYICFFFLYHSFNAYKHIHSRIRSDYKCTHKMNIYCSCCSYLLSAILFANTFYALFAFLWRVSTMCSFFIPDLSVSLPPSVSLDVFVSPLRALSRILFIFVFYSWFAFFAYFVWM